MTYNPFFVTKYLGDFDFQEIPQNYQQKKIFFLLQIHNVYLARLKYQFIEQLVTCIHVFSHTNV